jgi:hypothetical protein
VLFIGHRLAIVPVERILLSLGLGGMRLARGSTTGILAKPADSRRLMLRHVTVPITWPARIISVLVLGLVRDCMG